jgi:hypothetical protein
MPRMSRRPHSDRGIEAARRLAAAVAVLAWVSITTAAPASAAAVAYQNMGLMRACLTVVQYAGQLGTAASSPDGAMETLQRAMVLDREVALFEDAAGAVAAATLTDAENGLTVHRHRAVACAAHGDCSPAAGERAAAFAAALKAACLTDYRSAP